MLSSDPFEWFDVWFKEAGEQEVDVPDAASIATVDANGRPSVRVVLVKEYNAKGFVFHTNYHSRKGHELSQNPYASVCFHWKSSARQVRIAGVVERTPVEESDAYFATRPRGSQLGAWASLQSETLYSPTLLAERLQEVEERYQGRDVPRPPHWGGYRLIPERIEFWQGRPDRLHDRFEFELRDGTWELKRLFP